MHTYQAGPDAPPHHMPRRILTAAAALTLAVSLAACSSPDYKSVTCKQWRGLSAGDAISVANDFENASGVHGDLSDFEDTISGACGPTRLDGTHIVDLQSQIVEVFLSVHPGDAG